MNGEGLLQTILHHVQAQQPYGSSPAQGQPGRAPSVSERSQSAGTQHAIKQAASNPFLISSGAPLAQTRLCVALLAGSSALDILTPTAVMSRPVHLKQMDEVLRHEQPGIVQQHVCVPDISTRLQSASMAAAILYAAARAGGQRAARPSCRQPLSSRCQRAWGTWWMRRRTMSSSRAPRPPPQHMPPCEHTQPCLALTYS